jgi:hypothetical protein
LVPCGRCLYLYEMATRDLDKGALESYYRSGSGPCFIDPDFSWVRLQPCRRCQCKVEQYGFWMEGFWLQRKPTMMDWVIRSFGDVDWIVDPLESGNWRHDVEGTLTYQFPGLFSLANCVRCGKAGESSFRCQCGGRRYLWKTHHNSIINPRIVSSACGYEFDEVGFGNRYELPLKTKYIHGVEWFEGEGEYPPLEGDEREILDFIIRNF